MSSISLRRSNWPTGMNGSSGTTSSRSPNPRLKSRISPAERQLPLQCHRLPAADLQEAGLTAVGLREADLQEVDLREAGLREAGLREVDLRAVGLRGADPADHLRGWEPRAKPAPGISREPSIHLPLRELLPPTWDVDPQPLKPGLQPADPTIWLHPQPRDIPVAVAAAAAPQLPT